MKTTSWRPWIMTVICAVCTGAVLLLYHDQNKKLSKVESITKDWRAQHGRLTPANTNLVFIGVTEGSYADVPLAQDPEAQGSPVLLAMRENWPWSRAVWAALIERLAQAGAKVIVLDIVFASPSAGDDQLARVLDQYRDKVVLGSYFSEIGVGGETSAAASEGTLTVPSPSVLPPAPDKPVALDDRVGYVNPWPDADGVIRRARFRRSESDFLSAAANRPVTLEHDFFYESLAARALTKFGHAEAIPAGEEPAMFRYTAPPGVIYRPHPVEGLFRANIWKNNYQEGEFFRGKLVMVGPAANIFHDEHLVPLQTNVFGVEITKMLGPEVHLNVINAALHGEFLRETSRLADYLVIALVGVLALFLCFRVSQPVFRLIIIVAITVGYWFLSVWLLDHANLVILLFSPLVVLNFCGVASLSYDFIIEQIERLKVRTTMGYYFSARVLDEVLANPGAMNPRQARVTGLLTDLRNSTPLAERLGPQGMFQLLNQVFEVQTAAIMGEEGNLEHFLGDQFLSYWGAPQEQPDATDRSLRAALRLIEGMEKLRQTFPPEIVELFGYGVALHSGPVLVGNKGSAKRMDYGLVGDTINEAARVEALTKHYGVTLLITREAFDNLTQPPPNRLIDRVIVKGKSIPVELLEVQNPRSAVNFAALAAAYEAVFKDYAAGHFAFARAEFQKLAEEHHDGASWRMAERCAALAANPPADWDGVWRMESK